MLLLDLLLHDWTYSVLLFYQGILCWKAQKARERERDKEKKKQLFSSLWQSASQLIQEGFSTVYLA